MNIMKNKDPRVLLAEAREISKNRVSMTRNACDRAILILNTVVGMIACNATRFGRIIQQGRREISEDLNVYNYM